jgi:hypothetical protein
VTSVWFIAVDDLGDELSVEARKGDQLIVEGVVLREHWSSQNKRTEANQRVNQEFIFSVTGYRFGARRLPPGTADASQNEQPPLPCEGPGAEVAAAAQLGWSPSCRLRAGTLLCRGPDSHLSRQRVE